MNSIAVEYRKRIAPIRIKIGRNIQTSGFVLYLTRKSSKPVVQPMSYLVQPIWSIEEEGLKIAGKEVYTTKTNKRQLESLKRQLNTLEQNTKLV